jgi:hypothetical protein
MIGRIALYQPENVHLFGGCREDVDRNVYFLDPVSPLARRLP